MTPQSRRSNGGEGIHTNCHPPFAGYHPSRLFLFRMLKVGLAGLLLFQDSFKTSWEGVVRTINKDELASSFWWYCERWTNAFESVATTLRKV
jgi:hypothetical protein